MDSHPRGVYNLGYFMKSNVDGGNRALEIGF